MSLFVGLRSIATNVEYKCSSDMNERILEILESLIEHEISKSEAQSKLLHLYSVVGSKPNAKAALNASVSAIYFSDSSDYRSYHYKVIRSLTGLDEVSEININRLFNELNPE